MKENRDNLYKGGISYRSCMQGDNLGYVILKGDRKEIASLHFIHQVKSYFAFFYCKRLLLCYPENILPGGP